MKKTACILLSILLLIGSLFGSYWIEGDGLEEYAMELIENHDLPTGGA